LVKSLEDNLTIQREKFITKISDLNGTLNSALERNRELKTLVETLDSNISEQKSRFTKRVADLNRTIEEIIKKNRDRVSEMGLRVIRMLLKEVGN